MSSRIIISLNFHISHAPRGLSLVSPKSPSMYLSYEFLQVDSRRYPHRTFTCLCTPVPSYPLSRQTSLSIFIYPTKWLLALRIALALTKPQKVSLSPLPPVGKGKDKVSLM